MESNSIQFVWLFFVGNAKKNQQSYTNIMIEDL